MTGATRTTRPSAPAFADPMHCPGCAEQLASPVPFCPFCGTAQQRVVTLSRPIAEGTAPSATVAPEAELDDAAPVFTEPGDAPPLREPLTASPPGRKGRRSWMKRFLGMIAVAGVLLLVVRMGETPAPIATIVVRVVGPGGAAVTTGYVTVNERQAGAPGDALTVAPGMLRIGFEDPGWQSSAQTVTVAKDARMTVSLTARERPAHLNLTTNPSGAVIRIQGRSYGQAPLNLDLLPGNFELSASLAGYTTKLLPLTLARGEGRTINIDLASIPPVATPLRFLPPPFVRGVTTADTPLLANPSRNAEVVALLPASIDIQVQAQVVAEETWLQVRAAGHQGYLPGAGLVEPWESWAQRNTTMGLVTTITPDLTIVIAGRTYPLFGVRVPDRGVSALGLGRVSASLISLLKGGQVKCIPHDTTNFVCKTAEGRDISELYLLNGAAAATDDALPYYFEAQRAAHDKQKGMWAE